MANFSPLNNYILYIIDQSIKQSSASTPFLDIGCGSGYISAFLLSKGWKGKAIDSSGKAIANARYNLRQFSGVKIEKKDVMKENKKFKTILIQDVIEHIKDDQKILNKIYSLLEHGGFLMLGTPSNPTEWRWDDDFYGHYRRYTKLDLETKLKKANLHPIFFWDYTFPFFWFMRRLYTYGKKPKNKILGYKDKRTEESSFSNAWGSLFFSSALNKATFLWRPVYWIQFRLFKHLTSKGSGFFVLAQKK